ncbi:GNAT family N-acetyltransferase [Oceanomicrobium pacificus]|uniref:L-ornithine N(alpha)-acyltransferase n=1 Tax=Oceanomicrobium pacificus TaxID=2692916 RepID=A0A6B0TXY0_9RHOB|nr:GNAT family N-acyltransferase [Oceanomicrobium pacificus]MXU66152.1 GNAT family N-acetyltransferase [Oceanomicrobium pacificus]
MKMDLSRFDVRLATTDEEVRAAQHLRYRVFVEEMGATVPPEDAALKIERDRFDPYFDHLLLIDRAAAEDDPARVIGVYRLLRGAVAKAGPGFYGAGEFDLTPLLELDRETVELGRSCVAQEFRAGSAMLLLWNGVSRYVRDHGIEVMFGTASFPGTDPAPLAEALSHLHHAHLAPPDIRVRAQPDHGIDMNLMPAAQVNAGRAMRATPALIKAYLRLGGFVGEGAYVDHGFNTIDVCLLMDTERMVAKYRDFYSRD